MSGPRPGRGRRRPPGAALAVRIYGWAAATLPREHRDQFGDETVRLFGDLYDERLREKGRLAAIRYWTWSMMRLAACVWRARREGPAERSTIGGARPPHGGRGGDVMAGLVQDARYAARALRKTPGFAVTAALILAAGIGSTTTIFSVVDAVVLRPLPYPEAGRLIHFDQGSHSYPLFAQWRELESFGTVAAARDVQVDYVGDGAPERIPAASVSEDFFELFGASPHLGRLLGPGDFPGDRSEAVVSHGFWTRIGADPDIVGRTLTLDGAQIPVVGVLSPSFRPPALETGSRVDVWFALDGGGEYANDHGYHVLGVAGRLRPELGLSAAQAEVDAQRDAIAAEVPRQYVDREGRTVYTPLVEMHEATVRRVRGTLFMLLGAVGMMLLIACANVANLFLARGAARAREVALRGALGASRMRIASQILTESVVLSLFGGVLGVGLAFLGVETFVRLMPEGLPRIDQLAVDQRVLWFSVAISVGTGILFGLLPALQAMHGDVVESLKESAATMTTSRGGRRVRSALVVSEVALAVVLVAGAGLLLRSLDAMISVDPGFDTEQLVILPMSLDAGFDDVRREQFVAELMERVASGPGVGSVSVSWSTPFRYTGSSRCCWRTSFTGDPALEDPDRPFQAIVHPVSQDYFPTLGVAPITGRVFEDDEVAVAMLNRPAAEALFGTESAVGRTIQTRDDQYEIVGVVEGVHHWGLSQDVEAAVYLPWLPEGPSGGRFELMVRTSAPFGVIAEHMRQSVWAIDADLPVGTVTTMDARIGASLAEPRFLSSLLGGFALVALLLACGGIYGSMLYNVGQRRHEMGIRLALGAAGSDVVRLVLRQGIALTVLGIALGTAIGLSASRVMTGLVWGVEPTDPITFVGTALVLGATAVFASFLPAWRAGRTDPLRTLRSE